MARIRDEARQSRRRGVVAGLVVAAVTGAATAGTQVAANGGPAGEEGRLVVKEKIANKFGIYEEGAISYLRVRRAADGKVVVRRRYPGTRIRLDELLPARRYKLSSFVRPCAGDCQDPEPPTDRCSGEFRLPPGGEVMVRIVTNDGSPCRIRFPDNP